MNLFEKRQITPKSHACEEKQSKCSKELMSVNCKFISSSRIVIKPKTKYDVWQSIINQPLQLIFSLESHITGKQISKAVKGQYLLVSYYNLYWYSSGRGSGI